MADTLFDAVLQKHTARLMLLAGVVGVGQGERDGQPCISVFVVTRSSDLLSRLPAALDGYVVDPVETGEIEALKPGER